MEVLVREGVLSVATVHRLTRTVNVSLLILEEEQQAVMSVLMSRLVQRIVSVLTEPVEVFRLGSVLTPVLELGRLLAIQELLHQLLKQGTGIGLVLLMLTP